MTLLLGAFCFLLVTILQQSNEVLCLQDTLTEISTTSARTTPKFQNRNLCERGVTIVNGKHSCKGKIIFQENFFDLSKKWKPEIKFSGDPDYEFAIYSDNQTNLFVKDDILHIKPSLTEERYGAGYVTNPKGIDFGESCTGLSDTLECVQNPRAWQVLPPVISAQISTIGSFSFLYGNIEIKAKFPKGDWLYPEISLASKGNAYGPGLESGRVRIAFSPGNKDLGIFLWSGCTLGYSIYARKFAMRYISAENPWYDDFHVYRLQWNKDKIILSVDNDIYGTIYPPYDGFASESDLEIDPFTLQRWQSGTVLAPIDEEMYIVLGVGVGGQMFHEEVNITKPWNNNDPKAQLHFYRKTADWHKTWGPDSELLVEYVKVWAV